MTKTELSNLLDLLITLQGERRQEYRDKGYDVDEMSDEKLYELDDGDNLLESVDNLIYIVNKKKLEK